MNSKVEEGRSNFCGPRVAAHEGHADTEHFVLEVGKLVQAVGRRGLHEELHSRGPVKRRAAACME